MRRCGLEELEQDTAQSKTLRVRELRETKKLHTDSSVENEKALNRIGKANPCG